MGKKSKPNKMKQRYDFSSGPKDGDEYEQENERLSKNGVLIKLVKVSVIFFSSLWFCQGQHGDS